MTISRARALRYAIDKMHELPAAEELVRVELLLMGGGDWLWALETRRVYGPAGRAVTDLRTDAIEALIEGRDEWHVEVFGLGDLDPTSEPARPSFAEVMAEPHPVAREAVMQHVQAVAAAVGRGDSPRSVITDDPVGDKAGVMSSWDNLPEADDDEEPERPAIIGATPEEVRQRIAQGRAAAAANAPTADEQAAAYEAGGLDDLPF